MKAAVHAIDCDMDVDCLCGVADWSKSIVDEGDRHGCCCVHVVESLEAMPAAPEEQYSVGRDKYYSCPHKNLTALEIYLMQVRP